MATQEQINLIADKIISAFGGDADKFKAFLVRANLQTEMDAIQSQIRNAQTEQSADIDDYNAQIESLQGQLNPKQAEIDQL